MKAGEKSDSVTRSPEGIIAEAHLFDGVKRGLGIFLLLTVPVWLLVTRLVPEAGAQLAWLACYGILAMLWMVWRIRHLLAAWEAQQAGQASDGDRVSDGNAD